MPVSAAFKSTATVEISSAKETTAPEPKAQKVEAPPRREVEDKEHDEVEEEAAPKAKVKTVFDPSKVINSECFFNDRPIPHKVKTDIDEIEMNCELCLELPCCPEHCCDVSSIHSPVSP